MCLNDGGECLDARCESGRVYGAPYMDSAGNRLRASAKQQTLVFSAKSRRIDLKLCQVQVCGQSKRMSPLNTVKDE